MGLFSGLFGGASDAARRGREKIQNVKIPKAADLQLSLEELVAQGVLTPEQLQTIVQPGTEFAQIQEDPTLRGQQVDALTRYGEIAEEGGMDDQFRAQLFRAAEAQRGVNQGAQGAIMRDARARGVGGSNMEFVNRLLSQQQGATRAAGRGVEAAAEAQARRDNALSASAELAGGLRSADYSQAAREATAADAINRFNAANQQQVGRENVGEANVAQQLNLGEKQRISDKNVAIRNVEEEQNVLRTPMDVAQMQLGKAGQVAAAQQTEGVAKQQERDTTRKMLGQGLQMGAMAFSDEEKKTDIEPFDSSKVLGELTGSTYRYKDEGRDTGEREVGVMAQDLERVAPAAVSDGPEGKQIDYGKMGGLFMAAMADMNRRIEQMEGQS